MLREDQTLLATLFLHLFANFLRFIVTFFIRNRNCLDSANLLWDVFTGVVGSQDLDLMAVGSGQGTLTLGLTVHIQRSLTNLRMMTIRDVKQSVHHYLVTVTEDLLEAGWLVINFLLVLADFLLDSVAHLPVSLDGGLLAHHFVLIVTLLHVGRLTAHLQSVRY